MTGTQWYDLSIGMDPQPDSCDCSASSYGGTPFGCSSTLTCLRSSGTPLTTADGCTDDRRDYSAGSSGGPHPVPVNPST